MKRQKTFFHVYPYTPAYKVINVKKSVGKLNSKEGCKIRECILSRDVCINIWKIKGQIKAAHFIPKSVINRNRNNDDLNLKFSKLICER